jgi:hypothetical protein
VRAEVNDGTPDENDENDGGGVGDVGGRIGDKDPLQNKLSDPT